MCCIPSKIANWKLPFCVPGEANSLLSAHHHPPLHFESWISHTWADSYHLHKHSEKILDPWDFINNQFWAYLWVIPVNKDLIASAMCLFHLTAHSIFVMNIRKTTSTNINTRTQRITGHIFLDKEAICEIDHLQQCLPVKTTWWSFNIQEACAVTQKSRRQYHHSNRWSSLLLLEASFTWQLQQVTSLVSVSCLYIKNRIK